MTTVDVDNRTGRVLAVRNPIDAAEVHWRIHDAHTDALLGFGTDAGPGALQAVIAASARVAVEYPDARPVAVRMDGPAWVETRTEAFALAEILERRLFALREEWDAPVRVLIRDHFGDRYSDEFAPTPESDRAMHEAGQELERFVAANADLLCGTRFDTTTPTQDAESAS